MSFTTAICRVRDKKPFFHKLDVYSDITKILENYQDDKEILNIVLAAVVNVTNAQCIKEHSMPTMTKIMLQVMQIINKHKEDSPDLMEVGMAAMSNFVFHDDLHEIVIESEFITIMFQVMRLHKNHMDLCMEAFDLIYNLTCGVHRRTSMKKIFKQQDVLQLLQQILTLHSSANPTFYAKANETLLHIGGVVIQFN